MVEEKRHFGYCKYYCNFAAIYTIMETLMMRHFSRKYGIGTHTITRRIKEYDTVWVDGAAKPRIIDNDRNRQLAMKHKQIRRARPIKPLLTIEEFCAK